MQNADFYAYVRAEFTELLGWMEKYQLMSYLDMCVHMCGVQLGMSYLLCDHIRVFELEDTSIFRNNTTYAKSVAVTTMMFLEDRLAEGEQITLGKLIDHFYDGVHEGSAEHPGLCRFWAQLEHDYYNTIDPKDRVSINVLTYTDVRTVWQ